MKKSILFVFLLLFVFVACNNKSEITEYQSTDTISDKGILLSQNSDLPLDLINLPDGFKISIYATDISNARSMALSEKGILYVGNRSGDKVFAVVDTNSDSRADKKYIIAKGLYMPNGVAINNGDLYVAEKSKIWKYKDIDEHLNDPQAELIYDKFPTDDHHGWKFISFGPDGKLYVPVGAPCNICERLDNPEYASITRMNDDGSGLEVFAHGIRNTVGFTWHPTSNDLWFTDNGRDLLGDDIPADELNRAPAANMHFGYPYCHQGDIADEEYGSKRPCSDFTQPVQKLGPHVAALGLRFYTGQMFPEEYHNQLFIAEHGSWNRTKKIGYRISLVRLNGNQSTSYETFASGWLNDETQEAWGRPVDVQVMPDGALLVSDDLAGVVYRISVK